MTNFFLHVFLIYMLAASSCNISDKKDIEYTNGSFGYDLQFLQKYDSVILLKSGDDNAQIIVSPKYQAKVFTSTAEGATGLSFGWVNYKAFTANVDAHMNAYGGENRLWLGPEGGRFSLFFKPAARMDFNNWKTPTVFDTETWSVVSNNDSSVNMSKDMEFVNYQGTELSVTVNRNIRILGRQEIIKTMGLSIDDSVKAVGYETENILTNKGSREWTTETGMPCIWILDMFRPSDQTTIVIPYNGDSLSKPATTDYFGEIPVNRIKYADSVLFFKADGMNRGKLGIHPVRAKGMAGSYDANKKILTITLFDIDNSGKYLNQEWNTTKPPFSGDAVNAYNDGPLASGGQLGPFYELESVSPAAFLKPGDSLTHHHSVFHFTGNETGLNIIAEKVLSVSLEQIKNALP
ncbi:MAG TPA: DUF6786 family protein [Puia sp.]